MNKDSIKPTKSYKPFNNKVEVKLFGEPYDWNISHHKYGSVVLDRVAEIAHRVGIKKIFSPSPSEFNAKIINTKDLNKKVNVAKSGAPVEILRGCDADGVVLPKSSAYWLSSADCPTIIATDTKTGKTISAHGGRNSLIDVVRIATGIKARKNKSVVNSIMFKLKSSKISDIRVFIVSGIAPKNFLHKFSDKKHGKYNKLMVEYIIKNWGKRCVAGEPKYGKLDLVEIIKTQFGEYGIKRNQIRSTPIHTYEDRDKHGKYVWWSNRRGDKLKRNGVLVIRR